MVKKRVTVLILKTAGTNCDRETVFAFQQAGAEAEVVHINRLFAYPQLLDDFHIIAIPGGFTYGDDIAAGRILANELRILLRNHMNAFIDSGRCIIGICNGFQVLVKAGLLPGEKNDRQTATLFSNDSGMFESRWVHLSVEKKSPCIFTREMPHTIELPIAHAEGKFIADTETIEALHRNGQIVFSYASKNGNPAKQYPDNPNGSLHNIAGICDPTGRVLGMMPHPERFIQPVQHPCHTRHTIPEAFGSLLFKNAVTYIREEL